MSNKILYSTIDGSIIAMGPMPNLKAVGDQAVAYTEGSIPEPLSHYKFDGSKIIKKAEEVIDIILKAEDFKIGRASCRERV